MIPAMSSGDSRAIQLGQAPARYPMSLSGIVDLVQA
jgi:hypothetical protein